MKIKYLINIPADHWRKTVTGWDDLALQEQANLKKDYMRQLVDFLNGTDNPTRAVFAYDGVKINPITVRPRVKVIRSAGRAYKY